MPTLISPEEIKVMKEKIKEKKVPMLDYLKNIQKVGPEEKANLAFYFKMIAHRYNEINPDGGEVGQLFSEAARSYEELEMQMKDKATAWSVQDIQNALERNEAENNLNKYLENMN